LIGQNRREAKLEFTPKSSNNNGAFLRSSEDLYFFVVLQLSFLLSTNSSVGYFLIFSNNSPSALIEDCEFSSKTVTSSLLVEIFRLSGGSIYLKDCTLHDMKFGAGSSIFYGMYCY
jgi:hypothetical protein